ncbi:hypothetical protein [Emcibacter nanhaiensis]|uniref:MAPEG family protein n=1 Tax=Emcibacter nanhaiensis TaxID=1505037 RepID=A0A501PUA5_9PROT|nr:hypothetical protein [Emcibacter nanhaiensis]TPD64003.1 hypothetical protein FIV46_00055 [Emcibacter nanhaiensis]
MSTLITQQVSSPCIFVAFAAIVPLLPRLIRCYVEGIRQEIKGEFWLIFKGVGGETADRKSIPADFWLSYVIGFAEMLAYPLLIINDQTTMIGFWLGFKTIHRWNYAPNYDRGPYNLYLVGNLIVLMGAYFSARWAVI